MIYNSTVRPTFDTHGLAIHGQPNDDKRRGCNIVIVLYSIVVIHYHYTLYGVTILHLSCLLSLGWLWFVRDISGVARISSPEGGGARKPRSGQTCFSIGFSIGFAVFSGGNNPAAPPPPRDIDSFMSCHTVSQFNFEI